MANEKFKINGVVSEVVPVVGTTGNILKKTASGVEWGTLSKKDVELDNTPNYGVATQSEAETGTSNTKLMTPLRVNQAVVKLAPVPNYPVTSVNNRTGAVTISKSDVGLSNVNNVAITAVQVTKINELSYTRALTQAQYDALSPTEKNRADVWYGTYKE